MRMMLKWHPMVAADLHGHVATYFFPPAARPVNANIVGDPGKWLELFGRANAAAFDRYGWMYYSRDVYDLYYPGYYDAWPSLNGAIGMTFETDGGGHRGVLWRRADGTLLSLRDGIAKHFVASLATIEATASRARGARARLRRLPPARGGRRAVRGAMRRVDHRAGARSRARRGAGERAAARRHRGAPRQRGLLRGTRARVRRRRRRDAPLRRRRVRRRPRAAAGQGRARRSSSRRTSSTRRSRRRRSRSSSATIAAAAAPKREEYEFYDITAWSLPVAFGVDAYWTDDAAPSPASCSRSPPRSPRCRRRGSSRVASAASCSRWTSAAASSRDAARRRRTSSAPSATARRARVPAARRGLPRRRGLAADRRGRPPVAARHVRRARRAQRLHARHAHSTRSPARAASR